MCQVPTQEQICVGIKDSTQCSTMGCTLNPSECIRLDTQVGCCRWDCAGDCANVATNQCVPRTGPTDLCQMPTQTPCQSCSPSQIEEGCFFLPSSSGGAGIGTQEQACVGIKDQTQCSTLGCSLNPQECIALDTQVGCCKWDCAGDCANVATNKCLPRTSPSDLCQTPGKCLPCALCPEGQERRGCTGNYAGDCVDCEAGTFALASDAYCRPCPEVRKCVLS